MPRRVPARGRGRETELCIILSQGELPKAEGVPLPNAERINPDLESRYPCEHALEQVVSVAPNDVAVDVVAFISQKDVTNELA